MKFPALLFLSCLAIADCPAQSPDWTLIQPATSPSARGSHAMAYDADRKVTVLFGGSDTLNQLRNDTWEYDGKTWQEIKPALSPSARAGHMMVYDSTRKLTVLYGPGRDTWTWDGAVWTKIRIPAAQKPSLRNGAGMAFDENRGRIVLFGGYDNLKGLVSDTWEFNGAVWGLMSSVTNAPPARKNHAMAYDSIRKQIVLFGGSDNQTGYLNDTWEWNGILWRPVTPATTSPPARQSSSGGMVYDKSRRRTLLYGGWNGGRVVDTWEYDGNDWSQIMTATTPPARNSHALVHDADRGRTILFGGQGALTDLWEYAGSSCYMTADVATIPIATGGAQTLTLDTGPVHANKPYWIFGSITGTTPGISVNGI
ncbi:MAG: kelch repeat-containing protein, partial [Planctomycetota bacterium]|nr:kelch repeat-containing protein [Planctomycetota bacterium]